jgi:aminoglycoside phosphotransferase (APT) family kinase protein
MSVTEPTTRDDAALAAALVRWLADRHGHEAAEVRGLRRPSAGYSSQTVIVDAAWSDLGRPVARQFVVRLAPEGRGTFPHYDLGAQVEAQLAAAAAGVPIATPVLEADPRWLGAPFVSMPFVAGHIVGEVAHLDRWLSTLTAARRNEVHRAFLTAVARIHRAVVPARSAIPQRDNAAELRYWEEYLDWSSGGSPVAVLVDALRWCRGHLPPDEPAPALLWGDVRFGNAVLGDDLAVRAVLDWDMTSVGAPEHDLAWFTGLDLTATHLFGRRAEGFPDREATVSHFEELSGRPVRHLDWYETLALLRSAAIMTRLGYIRQGAGEAPLLPIDDNPILDLLRSRLV